MGRPILALLAAVAVVAFAGCGGDGDSSGSATTPAAAASDRAPATTTTQARRQDDPRLRRLDRAERDARDFCASAPLAKIKAAYGGTESFSAARAYAQQAWQEGLREVAETGCIKGMQDRDFK